MRLSTLSENEIIKLAAIRHRGEEIPYQERILEHFENCQDCYEKYCVAFTMINLAGLEAPESENKVVLSITDEELQYNSSNVSETEKDNKNEE